jgi:hypothetical protein
LKVTGGAKGVAAHAGARLLCDLADVAGLSEALSVAMAPTKQRGGGHDRGGVLVDLAVMLADGGTTISDLSTLSAQPGLFGDVASVPTAWRTLAAVDETVLERIKAGRAAARAQAWALGADPGFYVVDFDATLVDSHSDKEGAAPTYKRGFGFYPLMAYLDATGEALAGLLRAGNAGSGTTQDHVTVLDDALTQLPIDPHRVEVIARSDTGGLSHGLVDACRERNVRFVTGHRLTAPIAATIIDLPRREWMAAITADGGEDRDGAQVAELTGLVDLEGWPTGTRMLVRREDPHPGAQLTFCDVDGHRYQVILTDLTTPDIAYIEALYRGRGRAERRICDAKDTGLANLPSASFAINAAWIQCVLVAQDLFAWAQALELFDGELARAEPKRLRYCLLHVPGTIVRRSRQRWLRLPQDWPWTNTLIAAYERLDALALRI